MLAEQGWVQDSDRYVRQTRMLVDIRILSLGQAVEVLQIPAEVKIEVAAAAGESKARMNESLALLEKISNSFECDRV
jgi:hypothetical protein